MGSWYWLGVSAGVGAALGVLGVALIGPGRRRALVAIAVGVVAGLAAGLLIGGWTEAALGAAGGALGALGGEPMLRGTLERGGTRGGTAALLGGAAVVIAALAFVPVLGYLVTLAVPMGAWRARRRSPERYAGLRTLARD